VQAFSVNDSSDSCVATAAARASKSLAILSATGLASSIINAWREELTVDTSVVLWLVAELQGIDSSVALIFKLANWAFRSVRVPAWAAEPEDIKKRIPDARIAVTRLIPEVYFNFV
jgi:hypothetical protein